MATRTLVKMMFSFYSLRCPLGQVERGNIYRMRVTHLKLHNCRPGLAFPSENFIPACCIFAKIGFLVLLLADWVFPGVPFWSVFYLLEAKWIFHCYSWLKGRWCVKPNDTDGIIFQLLDTFSPSPIGEIEIINAHTAFRAIEPNSLLIVNTCSKNK